MTRYVMTAVRRPSAVALASLCLIAISVATPSVGADNAFSTAAPFNIEEATIADIQKALLNKQVTTRGIVELYLARIKAYNGTCVEQPQGLLGPITPIAHAGQLNALGTLNLRPAARKAWGFDDHKARSMTDAADNDPAHAGRARDRRRAGRAARADRPARRPAPRRRHLDQGSVRHVRHADHQRRRCRLSPTTGRPHDSTSSSA